MRHDSHTDAVVSGQKPLSISFVIPCLNEARTLGSVLGKINDVRRSVYSDYATEIIVADNGSEDASAAIACKAGATVVSCSERGYGAALQCGFKAAKSDIIVFADADDTYDFREAPKLIAAVEKGADLVIGSRLGGTIYPGAMPFLHRYIGTPVLNALINILYTTGKQHITDCNSGFRSFRREQFFRWNIHSSGMEFASEMLVKALQAGARIDHVPILLYPDRRDRRPHLQTWRDGMRHLLQILLQAPQFFSATGSTIFGLSWLVLIASLLWGPRLIGSVSILGPHTMMFMVLGSQFGLSVWGIGLFLSARRPKAYGVYTRLLALREDTLLWSFLVFCFVGGGMLAWIILDWARHDFRTLALEQLTLVLIAAASNVLVFATQMIAGHLMKRV